MRIRAEITQKDKDEVRSAISKTIEHLSATRAVCIEAIANEAFYWLQRHPQWGRNASASHKKASFLHWKGLCHRCQRAVALEEAKFHHLHRGVPNQHGPRNLVPQHLHCHDEEHGALRGSLSKGSPVKKARGSQQTVARDSVKKRGA
jgi:hypothetical protein